MAAQKTPNTSMPASMAPSGTTMLSVRVIVLVSSLCFPFDPLDQPVHAIQYHVFELQHLPGRDRDPAFVIPHGSFVDLERAVENRCLRGGYPRARHLRH